MGSSPPAWDLRYVLDYRDWLRRYLEKVEVGHTPHTVADAFRMHDRFLRTGDMRGVEWLDA